jgi:type IV pilus assembly protein PilM
MAKNCIGLDIGSSSVKAVKVKEKKGKIVVQAFGIEPLMAQSIVDGTIMDQGAVADAIRTLWARLHLKEKNVAVAIAGHSVIIKKISVPPMSNSELAQEIPFAADEHIPFNRDEVKIDYELLNKQNATGQMDVVLVAAKNEVVEDYASVVREAGLNPSVIDVCAFSAQNALELNYDLDPNETFVLINVGAAISNINILRGDTSLFSRDVTIGGNAFTEEIQKQLGVSHEEAEAYKVGGSYDEHGVVPQEVERIIEGTAESIAGEFQRSIDFFLATSADTNVTKIILAGGCAKVSALQRAFERRSRLTVELADAWRRVELDPRLDSAYMAAHSTEALVGLGLALRSPNDK